MRRDEKACEEFRSRFNVGDIITPTKGCPAGRPLLITAIGLRRFLYINADYPRDERVSQIYKYCQEFRKWNPKIEPDKQYSYIVGELEQDREEPKKPKIKIVIDPGGEHDE